MYITLFKSYLAWLESRGDSRKDAIFRAGVAFSILAMVATVSLALLLDVITGVPIEAWAVNHSVVFWILEALIVLFHWYLARAVTRERGHPLYGSTQGVKSKYIWVWYAIPVFGLLIAAVAVAVVYANSIG